jgi:hypothetical protein
VIDLLLRIEVACTETGLRFGQLIDERELPRTLEIEEIF